MTRVDGRQLQYIDMAIEGFDDGEDSFVVSLANELDCQGGVKRRLAPRAKLPDLHRPIRGPRPGLAEASAALMQVRCRASAAGHFTPFVSCSAVQCSAGSGDWLPALVCFWRLELNLQTETILMKAQHCSCYHALIYPFLLPLLSRDLLQS